MALVTQPWVNLVARRRFLLVVSIDVEGDGPTLAGGVVSTLGIGVSTIRAGLFSMMAVSLLIINAFFLSMQRY